MIANRARGRLARSASSSQAPYADPFAPWMTSAATQLGQASARTDLRPASIARRNPPPGDAVDSDDVAPARAVLARQHAGDAFAEPVGSRIIVSKKARKPAAAIEMGRLDDERRQAIGYARGHQQRNHGAVAVPPEHGRSRPSASRPKVSAAARW